MALSAPPDQRSLADAYLREHKVNELFEELGTACCLHKPDDTRAFLLEQLERIKACKESSKQPSVFDSKDMTTLFNMFDLEKRGRITPEQACKALEHLGVKAAGEEDVWADDGVTLDAFLERADNALRERLSA